jgi:hypothetical protein
MKKNGQSLYYYLIFAQKNHQFWVELCVKNKTFLKEKPKSNVHMYWLLYKNKGLFLTLAWNNYHAIKALVTAYVYAWHWHVSTTMRSRQWRLHKSMPGDWHWHETKTMRSGPWWLHKSMPSIGMKQQPCDQGHDDCISLCLALAWNNDHAIKAMMTV